MAPISENEMILDFLLAELNSSRFSHTLKDALKKVGADIGLISKADLNDKTEDEKRKAVLAQYRGYPDRLLFASFPAKVDWYKKQLSRDEILNIKFSTYSYWVALSKGTRNVEVAAETIKNKEIVMDQSNDIFWNITRDLRNGKKLPRLICVSKSKDSDIVVIEGHSRLTAYALTPQSIGKGQEIILGISPKMISYGFYI